MRLSSATLLLAGLASGISAGVIDYWEDEVPFGGFIGTFDTFTNRECSQGGRGITVTDKDQSGELGHEVQSVKSYISSPNTLVIWVHGGSRPPLVIRRGDLSCHQLNGPGRHWNTVPF